MTCPSMGLTHPTFPPTIIQPSPYLQACLEPQKKSRMTDREHSQAPEVTTAIAQPIWQAGAFNLQLL
jgi:hypothetical protein